VMDAVLGALGKDDIGTHFPDTDPQYKGISSLVLLEKVAAIMRESGYHLCNLDALLHADEPKVKAHIPAMRRNIAAVFECNEQRINVKATTWEGLGFAGAGEGMAASAVCLIIPETWDEDSEEIPFATPYLFEDVVEKKPKPERGEKMKATRGRLDKKKAFTAHIDGASRGNPGPAAIGVIVRDPDGLILAEISEAIGEATNNVAEYRALIRALEECSLLKAEQVLVYTDSQLLAKQIDGKYKVKNPGLRRIFDKAIALASDFSAFAIEHIPRPENKEADALANSAFK
jgi:2-C-methyl-D-erythritol 2,4-cyclodiphosphate synthase